jgi:glucose-6-phosphate 1-dehydrogenase
MDMSELSTDVRGSFCSEDRPERAGIVIFGASGDLTHRKLIPSLFSLYQRRLLPERCFILGCARTPTSDESFRIRIAGSLEERLGHPSGSDDVMSFVRQCYYHTGDYKESSTYSSLAERLSELDREYGVSGNYLFYLATPPNLYTSIATNLGHTGLTKEPDNGSWVRLVFEKPFGRDLESAMDLDSQLHRVLEEHQIYRIDHYLGKETVQNILMLRFANSVFEPIWNRRYIDHVQITVAESIGIEHRAGYFEQAGLLRDMFQNHMLQMLSMVAMEPPISFDADRVRDEKVKLMRSIRPFDMDNIDRSIVRGQYVSAVIDGAVVPGYREERGVSDESNVETFLAVRLFVDNWRWQGVPIYMRAGKRMSRKLSQIAIVFKRVPHSMFAPLSSEELSQNVLLLNVQPDEGVTLTIQAKQPGAKLCMDTRRMEFLYQNASSIPLPDAYERLLLDCMLGDQTLFWRSDGVEVAWSLVTPVLRKWEEMGENCPIAFYEVGSWGPDQSDSLPQIDGRQWLSDELLGIDKRYML